MPTSTEVTPSLMDYGDGTRSEAKVLISSQKVTVLIMLGSSEGVVSSLPAAWDHH